MMTVNYRLTAISILSIVALACLTSACNRNVIPDDPSNLTISTAESSVESGESVTLNISEESQQGRDVSWTAEGGTLSPTLGYETLFTAGQSLGEVTIIATAVSSSGITSTSSVTINVTDKIIPNTPTGFQATPTDNAILLTWNQSTENLGGYKVYLSEEANTWTTVSTLSFSDLETTTPNMSYRLTDLTNGTRYYVAITAFDKSTFADESNLTDTLNMAPRDLEPPEKPSNFRSTVSGNTIHLTWNNARSTDLRGVKIVRNTNHYPGSLEDGTTIYDDLSESYVDTDITPGSTYYYSAFSYDEIPSYSTTAAQTYRIVIP